MARTQSEDYDERREKIVREAAKLYAARGFLGASVSDLAEACETSKSAIYHYYPSKEDILFDVMLSHISALDQAAADVLSEGGTPAAKLRELARTFMALYVGAADRHKVLLNELDQLAPARRVQIVDLQRRLIARIETLLGEIEPKLMQNAAKRLPAAMLFFGMINWTHTWFDPKGSLSAAAFADMTVDVILGGIASAV
jgi:AcrR family transcriptional regulator